MKPAVGPLLVCLLILPGSFSWCPDGMTELFPFCYVGVQKTRTWDDAAEYCKDHYNAVLPMVIDEANNDLIRSLVPSGGIWLGLKAVTPGDARYHEWVRCDACWYEDWLNWKEGEPNQLHGEEDCVVMLDSGEWNDFKCDGYYYFVCMK